MAKIQFTGFVEDVKGDWMLKTAEPHRKQVDGKWETVGRTFRMVKAAYNTPIDFSTFQKGDRVEVEGTESTVTREYNGQKYYDLVVKADSVKPVVSNAFQETFPVGSSDVDESLPF
jgi:hypothetical protein